MPQSILEIATGAADELSLERPTSVISTDDDETGRRLARILVATIKDLSARYDWQVLMREHTFTTVAADVQTGAVASDFLRFIQQTGNNRTSTWRIHSVTPQEYQYQKARTASVAITDQWRRRGNSFLIYPNPPADETIAYEYITNRLCWQSDASTERTETALVDDTDIPFLNDELLTLGLVWRYRKSEGLDYSEEFRNYENYLFDMLKSEGGHRRIDMSDSSYIRVPTKLLIPDTFDGLT